MTVRAVLKRVLRRSIRAVVNESQEQLLDRRNVDLFLSAVLHRAAALSEIRNPTAYVGFLRSCLERSACWVREVKGGPRTTDSTAKRFSSLLDALQRGMPPIEFSAAQEIAL